MARLSTISVLLLAALLLLSSSLAFVSATETEAESELLVETEIEMESQAELEQWQDAVSVMEHVLESESKASGDDDLVCPNGAALRQLYQPTFNGCGAEFTDPFLPKLISLNKLYPCCDDHDVCYGTIGRTQEQCDDIFRSCMEDRCDRLYQGGSRFSMTRVKRTACRKAASIMYHIVDKVGSKAYEIGQLNSGCQGEDDKRVYPADYKVDPAGRLNRMRENGDRERA